MFDKIRNAASNLGDLGQLGDLQQYVEGLSFPASKDEIIGQLEASGAREDIIAKVQEVGQNQFQNPGDLLSSFLGKR